MNFKQLNLTGNDNFDPNDLIDEDSDDNQNEILLRYKNLPQSTENINKSPRF